MLNNKHCLSELQHFASGLSLYKHCNFVGKVGASLSTTIYAYSQLLDAIYYVSGFSCFTVCVSNVYFTVPVV